MSRRVSDVIFVCFYYLCTRVNNDGESRLVILRNVVPLTLPESSSYRCNFSHVADNIFTRLRPRRFSVQILENILVDHQESKCINRRTHFGFLCSVFIVSSFSLSASSFPYKLRENSGCFFILVDPHIKRCQTFL